jgi:predicted peptidase
MKTILKIIAAILLTALLFKQSEAQTLVAHPTKTPIGIYPYWEYKPDSAKNLLIFVHGHGERGNGSLTELNKVLNIGIPKLIKNNQWKWKDFIVIAPQYPVTATYLYPPTFHNFILAAQKYYNIDASNTFLVGISGGGISVNKLINSYSDAAACLSISGAFDVFKYTATTTRLWAVHGEDDLTIPYTSAVNFITAYNRSQPAKFAKFEMIPNYSHEPGVWDRACSRDKYFIWMLNP